MSPKTQNKIVITAFFIGLAIVFAPMFFGPVNNNEIIAVPAQSLPGSAETGMDEANRAKH